MLAEMNKTIITKDWIADERALLVEKSDKGYSGIFVNHNKLCKKRVIVHKALEQKLSGDKLLLLDVKKLSERDKFYLVIEAEEVVRRHLDIVTAIAAAKHLVAERKGFMYEVWRLEYLEDVYVLQISINQSRKDEYYLFWVTEDGTLVSIQKKLDISMLLDSMRITYDFLL